MHWSTVRALTAVAKAGHDRLDADLLDALSRDAIDIRRMHVRALITGAEGSLGSVLYFRLRQRGADVLATDLTTGTDILHRERLAQVMADHRPDVIFHLGGAKHAPDGELDPWATVRTNVEGTRNVLDTAPAGTVVVVASTCKAADPETVYVATKLLAERLTLNDGQLVVRFYNVLETAGNVFRIWESLPPDEPLPVAPCSRYFIGTDDAINLLIAAAELPSGRYAIDPGLPRTMSEVASKEYPGRAHLEIPARRGDRISEPLHARCESVEGLPSGILRIESPHDPVPLPEQVRAAA